MSSRRDFLKAVGLTGAGLMIPWKKTEKVLAKTLPGAPAAPAAQIAGTTITKFQDPLIIPPAMTPDTTTYPGIDYYEIQAKETQQWLHKSFENQGASFKAKLWGYGQVNAPAGKPAMVHSPGFTIEAKKNVPVRVKWINNLDTSIPHPQAAAIDRTIEGTTMGEPDHRIVTHLHGAEVPSDSDGWTMAWYTPKDDMTGESGYRVYNYPNVQEAATLWYHDHSMGITRLNTIAGLAGFYLLRDPKWEDPGSPNFLKLPYGKYEIPLAIQDRLLNDDGTIFYPSAGINPDIHPQWTPEYFGDVIVVNGKAWPYLEVEPRKYRFRILNGSNARVYNLALSPSVPMYQIGTDGGWLPAPVKATKITVMPGERVDVIIDFTGLRTGYKLLLTNDAAAPFPMGDPADPATTGQIMQFRVVPLQGKDNSVIPASFPDVKPFIPLPNANIPERNYRVKNFTLNEMMGANGPAAVLVHNRLMLDPMVEEEFPVLGDTEVWQIINTTMDAHPIHLHLVQFNLLNRQKFDKNRYLSDYDALNPMTMEMDMALNKMMPRPAHDPVLIPVEPYLVGSPILPAANEKSWKDTIRMNPGEVTRILVRFDPRFTVQDYERYVYHCHILDHEDNSMMRPMVLRANKDLPIVPLKHHEGMPGMVMGKKAFASAAIPLTTTLKQNYPNPFNPTTEVTFQLANRSNVELKVYNINGQEVRTLFSGMREAGEHRVSWNGKNNWGVSVSSGMYICRLTAGDFTQSIKMNLVR